MQVEIHPKKIFATLAILILGVAIGAAGGAGYVSYRYSYLINQAETQKQTWVAAIDACNKQLSQLNRVSSQEQQNQTDTFTFLMEPGHNWLLPAGKSAMVWVIQGKVVPQVYGTNSTAGFWFSWQPKGALQQGPFQAQSFPGIPAGFMPGTALPPSQ